MLISIVPTGSAAPTPTPPLPGARFAYIATACARVVKFVASMSVSDNILALISPEFDVGDVGVGKTIRVKRRGKPMFIHCRTDEEVANEAADAAGQVAGGAGDLHPPGVRAAERGGGLQRVVGGSGRGRRRSIWRCPPTSSRGRPRSSSGRRVQFRGDCDLNF